ncbi:MAG: hypothetical protein ACRDE8_11220, partial [Ginsengibacter sp.]
VSLNKGKRLYNFWIWVQLISAAFSYFVILPAGWIGLSLATFLNTALMVLCSVLVVRESHIVISKTIDLKNLMSISFSALLFVIMSVVLNYFLNFSSSVVLIIAIKLLCAVFFGALLLFFRHKEFYQKLLMYVKPASYKLKRNTV